MHKNKKINILFILNNLGTGGSERVVLDISRRLNKDRFVPYVLSLNPPCSLMSLFSENDIWCRCFEKKRGIDIRLMLEIFKIIHKNKIDIVNAHHFAPLIHSSFGAILNHCRLFYTDHTVAEIERVPFYWKIMGTLILKTSSSVIGISHGCTRQLQKTFHIKNSKALTILNAIDLERFNQSGANCNGLRKDLNLDPVDNIIGIVGTLRAQKNHKNIIRAFHILKDKGVQAKLLIIGDGPLRGELEDLATSLNIQDQIIFLGANLNVESLYRVMDIYCLCSHYEGLPLTILEAMASQLPVVGTDVDGIREIINDGKTGMLVNADNPSALADMFIRLLSDKPFADTLALNGYDYVMKNHHMTPWIQTYENLFSLSPHDSNNF